MPLPNWAADAMIGIISAIHFAVSFAEVFLWRRIYPRLKQFDFGPKEAEKARPIVQNAGLYNAFIAAGLLWSALSSTHSLAYFFLTCVAVAGVFGAVTLKAPKTLVLQTFPAVVAVCLVWLSRP